MHDSRTQDRKVPDMVAKTEELYHTVHHTAEVQLPVNCLNPPKPPMGALATTNTQNRHGGFGHHKPLKPPCVLWHHSALPMMMVQNTLTKRCSSASQGVVGIIRVLDIAWWCKQAFLTINTSTKRYRERERERELRKEKRELPSRVRLKEGPMGVRIH